MAAIDNATAVPDVGQSMGINGAGDVPRRRLTMDDIVDVVHHEINQRRVAAETYRTVDALDVASDLEGEADMIEALLLEMPATPSEQES